MHKFFRLAAVRSALFLYLFALITGGALISHIVPIVGIVSGAIALSELNALSSVVSFAQWLIADNNIRYTFLFIIAAPAPVAILGASLFAGALGSFASGMETGCGFPAKTGMGIRNGYRKRFRHVLTLFYATSIVSLALIFTWIIAAIPLAVIRELESRGALQTVFYYITLAVTLLAFYLGSLFLRVYSLSFLPALYSGARKPVASAFSFASRGFFRVAGRYIIADIALASLISLYAYFGKPVYFLLLNCLVTTAFVFYLLYITFNTYADEGYGFDESDRDDLPDGSIELYGENPREIEREQYVRPDRYSDGGSARVIGRNIRDTMPVGGFETVGRDSNR